MQKFLKFDLFLSLKSFFIISNYMNFKLFNQNKFNYIDVKLTAKPESKWILFLSRFFTILIVLMSYNLLITIFEIGVLVKFRKTQSRIMYDFANYNEFTQSLTPNIWTKDADYKIDMALNAYNKTLEYYKLDNETNNDNKNIISKDDVIMLYDRSGLPLNMYYSEFLSNKLSFNISLMNKTNNNLYNDEAKINNAIQVSQTLEPGKVVVLYDLMGNIINPGVKLSESEELLTSSDAIYDSEQTILDNLFRTKIIRPEINKVFYKYNNEYLLLKNQVDMVYSLNINNKIAHFNTYNDARIYLYEYILFNAVVVQK